MITRPSCTQLLHVVKRELRESVAPAVDDPAILARLGMIDSILKNVAARCDHEVAWLREEIASIESTAEALIAAGSDRGHHVAAALLELRDNRAKSDHTEDVRTEYHRASEVLSRCLEVSAAGSDTASRSQALRVLESRLVREVDIRGSFELVGRG